LAKVCPETPLPSPDGEFKASIEVVMDDEPKMAIASTNVGIDGESMEPN